MVASFFFLGSSFTSPKSSGYFSQMEIIQNSSIDNIETIDRAYSGAACIVQVAMGDSSVGMAGTKCIPRKGKCKKSRGCEAVTTVKEQLNALNSETGVTIEDCQGWADAHAQDLITRGYYDDVDYPIIYQFAFNTLVRFYKHYYPRRH